MELDATLLNIQHYEVQIKGKWSNPGEKVAPSSTPRCSSYWKGSLLVALNYRQLTYLFDPLILTATYRVELGVMSMKRYSASLKAPEPEFRHQIVQYHIQDTHSGGGAYSSTEMQSVYSTPLANLARNGRKKFTTWKK